MTLNYQQVKEQVRKLGENALSRLRELDDRLELARSLLEEKAERVEELRQKVYLIAQHYDGNLRCAVPVKEPVNARFFPPDLPAQATILAADGSQINPDRNAEVFYCLTNLGAVQMRLGFPAAPESTIKSHLFYDQGQFPLTESILALERDLQERALLKEMAFQAPPPVITFTDGPMELWGARSHEAEEAKKFQDSLKEYLGVLNDLHQMNVTTAGYVDNPGADLVVRLLEIVKAGKNDLEGIHNYRPFQGITDRALFRRMLEPGQRSAVFAIQSLSIKSYAGALALHFFYLNVANPGSVPHLARVEIPAWVAGDLSLLNNLHAVLIDQCRILGSRPYPYLLHRAHETAVVTQEEQAQVRKMILQELIQRGMPLEISMKQALKDIQGRTRYGK